MVLTPRDQPFAIRTPCHAVNGCGVAAENQQFFPRFGCKRNSFGESPLRSRSLFFIVLFAWRLCLILIRNVADIPNLGAPIRAGGCTTGTIQRPGEAVNGAGFGEITQLFASRGVPHLYDTIQCSGCQSLAVWAPCDSHY